MYAGEIVHFIGLRIQDVEIPGRVVLAPMAGVTDRVYRRMAKKQGAALIFSEMVSADGLVRYSNRTYEILKFDNSERPFGIQLFGSDPDIMAEAARRIIPLQPDFIDLNFGCPVKKVIRRGAGAALLLDLPRLQKIASAVVQATPIPVLGKFRSGWNDKSIVAVKVGQLLEDSGVCAVTLHARTRRMGYSGEADWDLIRQLKESVSIPVIGSGDVRTHRDVGRMLEQTGCDLVMVGRGSLGNPWIFRMANEYLETGEEPIPPSHSERIDTCIKHIKLELDWLGEERGVRMIRKHIAWYLKGMPGNIRIKRAVFDTLDPDAVIERLYEYADELES